MALEVGQVRLDLPNIQIQDVFSQPQAVLGGLRDQILQQVAKSGRLATAEEHGSGGLIARGIRPEWLNISAMSYFATDKGDKTGPANGTTSDAGGSTDRTTGSTSTAKSKTAAGIVLINPEKTETLSEEGSTSSLSVAERFIVSSKRPFNGETYNNSEVDYKKSLDTRLSASLKPEANAITIVSKTENKSRVFDISKLSVKNPVLAGIIGARLRTFEPSENVSSTPTVVGARPKPNLANENRAIALNNIKPLDRANLAEHGHAISLVEERRDLIPA
jgi:hypothetical protein